MQPSPVNARALAKSGMEALQKGDAPRARTAFEQILNAGQADASICLALAYACRVMKDGDAMIKAVDHTLTLEPGNLRALIMLPPYLLWSTPIMEFDLEQKPIHFPNFCNMQKPMTLPGNFTFSK